MIFHKNEFKILVLKLLYTIAKQREPERKLCEEVNDYVADLKNEIERDYESRM